MRRLIVLLILIIFTLMPLVGACMNPADRYAVEAVFNKPGVMYKPYPSFYVPHNALVENKTFLFRSHYNRRLYVLLWNASDGPHLKVGIPVEWGSQTVSVASLNVFILLTGEVLRI